MATALNVSAWSTTAASNDGADSTIGTVANTSAPNVVDDWVRGIMAAVKRYILDTDGGITAGGTANALTITTNRSISSGHQAAGFSVRFKASNTNTGATTVNVDSLGAKSIKRLNGDALSAGDIVSGGIYDIAYDGTNYILLGAGPGTGTYGTLSSDNTWSGANTFTGALNIGNSDTTLSRVSAGNVAIEGKVIYRAEGTDVAIADGGTGQSTAAAGFKALAGGVADEGFTLNSSVDHIPIQDNTDGTWGRFDITDVVASGMEAMTTSLSMTNTKSAVYVMVLDGGSAKWVRGDVFDGVMDG